MSEAGLLSGVERPPAPSRRPIGSERLFWAGALVLALLVAMP